MHPALRAAFEQEMTRGETSRRDGDLDAAFRHYERAHILGQRFVVPHVRSHVAMLRVGWARRDGREVLGQLFRLPGAVVGSAIGVVPTGNTGGANVSAFRPMEIPEELQRLLDRPEDTSS